ncbi:MAG: hypothetical protein ACFHVJ_10060 [Aestuariibacter sp.]
MLIRRISDSKPSKFCIICGEKPENKNKEHIIPDWLIKQTGDPSRKVNFGVSIDPETEKLTYREFAFDQFVFPACEACNSEFGQLEKLAKTHLNKLMLGQELEAQDISILLDWFDKIRVGLWLAMRVHHTNPVADRPNFFIRQRMGMFDRALIVEKLDTDQRGITFTGVNTYAFHYMPSAFSLRINEFIFTSISTNHLISRRLGFPYKTDSYIDPSSGMEVANISIGKKRVSAPIFQNSVLNRGILLAQPIYRTELSLSNMKSIYECDYVSKHSLEDGVGNIFVQRNHVIKEYSSGEKVSFSNFPLLPEEHFHTKNIDNVFDCQLWLVKNFTPSPKYLKPDQKAHFDAKLKYIKYLQTVMHKLSREAS